MKLNFILKKISDFIVSRIAGIILFSFWLGFCIWGFRTATEPIYKALSVVGMIVSLTFISSYIKFKGIGEKIVFKIEIIYSILIFPVLIGFCIWGFFVTTQLVYKILLIVAVIWILVSMWWMYHTQKFRNKYSDPNKFDLPDKRIESSCDLKRTDLSKSAIKHAFSGLSYPTKNVIFNTTPRQTSILPIEKTETADEFNILSGTYIKKRCPLTDKYEIHVNFSLHNTTEQNIHVYDMHARLYKADASTHAPLDMGYINHHRVDLYQDNSICRTGKIYVIEAGSAIYIDLVFECSFHGDTGTTIIAFGLFADFKTPDGNKICNYTIPSDKIYVVQYLGPPVNKTEASIMPMDGKYIQSKISTTPSGKIYAELAEIFNIHTEKGIQQIKETDI